MFAVDPVPWARAQMALTPGTHIILVPFGVARAFNRSVRRPGRI